MVLYELAGALAALWVVGVLTGHTGWGTIHILPFIFVPIFAMGIDSWRLRRWCRKHLQKQKPLDIR